MEEDMPATQTKDLRTLFDSLKPWHHLIYVDGIPTKTEPAWGEPLDHPIPFWGKIRPLLGAIEGKKVLDVGCNDGFFLFECRKLGASRVVGIEADQRFCNHAILINELLDLGGIEIKNISAYDITPDLGLFDITLLLGVFYHLKNPMAVIDKLSEITTEMIIIETAIRNSQQDINNRKRGKLGNPLMEFIEQPYKLSVYDGALNWWAPNTECVCAMLRSSGFRNTEVIEEYIFEPPQPPNRFGRAIIRALK